MTEMKQLLTSVAKLQEGGPDKDVSEVYGKKSRLEAEAIRSAALLAVRRDHGYDGDNAYRHTVNLASDPVDSNNSVPSFEWSSNDDMVTAGTSNDMDFNSDTNNASTTILNIDDAADDDDVQIIASSDTAAPKVTNQNAQSKGKRNNSKQNADAALAARVAQNDADLEAVNVFFNDNGGCDEDYDENHNGDRSEKLLTRSRRSNPKRDLVQYLENKSEVRETCIF